ncbi:non-specific lipid transfer protein GPI-anchored 30-like [Tasmannia lanceolata]|uniref:non-specific lipid transfer protein GPI-anchored 30-like n=1 Tax=Tasmannia lanceolata TaxID=3420 RepID=UPI0040630AC0
MEKVLALCFLLALAVLAPESHAQDTSCLTQLLPCLNYLNSTSTPPSSCCDPLKSVLSSNPQCLCNLLSSNTASGQTGINATQALQLPSKCGANVNAASCSTSNPTGTPTGTPTGSPTTQSTVPNSASRFSLVNGLLAAVLSVIIQVSWASSSIMA